MTQKNTYMLFILLSLIMSLNCYSDNLASPKKVSLPTGEWVAKIDNVGNVAIKCREYKQKVTCTVFWVFSELRFTAKLENGNLKLFNKDIEEQYLLLSLVDSFSKKSSSYDPNPSHKAPHKILQGGFLTAKAFSNFKSIRFKKGFYSDVGEFKKDRSDYNKYYDAGMLKQLPDSFPAWFINPTAYLFLNEQFGSAQGVNRLLEHKNLSPSTLKYIYNLLLTKRKKKLSRFNLVAIANHPSTSKDVLELLFNTKESSSLSARIWNAASNNPNAPASYKKEYIDRIKNSSEKLQRSVVSDQMAPPEILDWIARNGQNSFFSYSGGDYIFRNHNIWPKTLDYLAERFPWGDALKSIARNPKTSDKTLIKLAKIKIKDGNAQQGLLEILSKSYDRSPEAAAIALERLIKTEKLDRIRIAAKNPRLPKDQIDYRLSRSNSIRRGSLYIAAENPHLTKNQINILISSDLIPLRQKLANNKALNVFDLIKLAKDDYSHVAEVARAQLKSRYQQEYKKISPSLKPLSNLNPAYSIQDELQRATFTNDVELVKRLIKKYRNRKAPPYSINIDHVLKGDNKELQKILLEVTPPRKTTKEKIEKFTKEFMAFLPALILIFGAAVIVLIIIFIDTFIAIFKGGNKTSSSGRPYAKWVIVLVLSLYQVGCWKALDGFNDAFGGHSETALLPIFIIIVIIWGIYQLTLTGKKHEK